MKKNMHGFFSFHGALLLFVFSLVASMLSFPPLGSRVMK